jgi:putative Mg2+ transporter-C (MgtC) family protein
VPLSDAQIIVRLLLAAGIGGLLGAEREMRRKSAGFRTNILIAVGSCVFTLIALGFATGDPTRVPGQIVTGIGFLGGGVIVTQGGSIRGMTSAAVIWTLAAIGAAIGLGLYQEAIALTFISTAVLIGVQRLERTFTSLRRGVHADESHAPHEESNDAS